MTMTMTITMMTMMTMRPCIYIYIHIHIFIYCFVFKLYFPQLWIIRCTWRSWIWCHGHGQLRWAVSQGRGLGTEEDWRIIVGSLIQSDRIYVLNENFIGFVLHSLSCSATDETSKLFFCLFLPRNIKDCPDNRNCVAQWSPGITTKSPSSAAKSPNYHHTNHTITIKSLKITRS